MLLYSFLYLWTSFDLQGKVRSGGVWARDSSAVRLRLQRARLMPVAITLSWWMVLYPPRWWDCWKMLQQRDRLSRGEVIFFCRTMPVLMQGGFSFSEALSMVAVAASSDALKSCVTRLMVELSSGTPISSAFAAAADTWPSVVSLALSAVAGTGKTADILLHLADAFDADQRYRNDVGQALLVPVITGVGALVVLAGALYWCADQLGDHTSRLLFVGRWLYEYGLLVMILSAMVIVALVYSVRRSKVASIFRDRLVLAIPFFGAVGGQSDAILFFTVIALLLRAGVPLVPALRSGKLLVSNAYWRQLMNRFINDLEQGISLREAVAHLPAVCAPPVFVAGVVTATDAQQLVVVCNNTAQLVALQRAQLLSRFLVVLQPALLLFIGLVLAGFLYIVTQALSMSCVSMGTL